MNKAVKKRAKYFWVNIMTIFLHCLYAFAVGGALCAIGQLLIDYTKLTPARILVGYVVAGVALTGLGIYDAIVRFADAGATVPLTGFGYAIAKGVVRAVEQYGPIGVLCGGMIATASGITAALLFGLLASLFFNSGDKT